MVHIKVYTKENCAQCTFVKKFFAENAIPFDTKDVTYDKELLEEARSYGFAALPIIVADGVEPFYGFNPDKLAQVVVAYKKGEIE